MPQKGIRLGGRQKGTPNKATAAKAAAVAASGLTPLDYMLMVMRDEQAPPERRDEMAKAAAPYVHPKRAAIAEPAKESAPPQIIFTTLYEATPPGLDVRPSAGIGGRQGIGEVVPGKAGANRNT